jgi:tetratricopeptide (TPR) repeat protein
VQDVRATLMPQPEPIPFLDVQTLLESSQPRPRGGWFWYAAAGFAGVVIVSAILRSQSGTMAQVVSVFSAVAMIGILAAMMLVTFFAVRTMRGEQQQIEAAEELIQLRRWPEAAMVLQRLLCEPTRTPQARAQGLIYLSSVLARYNRFDDAIAVQTHLLEHINLDPQTAHALRLGRAMAMLREDHLFDADRAIAELRREMRSGEETGSPASRSGGLALVELYRDVKTGHPREAIETFEAAIPVIRRQLGHRAGDAYALLARAYDLLDRRAEAQQAFESATLLCPAAELARRYPELDLMFARYRTVPPPPEVA